MRFFRFIDHGAMFPRFHGIYRRGLSEGRNGAWCCPIPLNLVIGFCRWVYYACLHGFPIHWNDQHAQGRYGSLYRCCRCHDCGKTLRPTAEERADGGSYG